jgi:hypothetical protein
MTRRAVKKALRRAEEALQAQRYLEAHGIYAGLLMALEGSEVSLLDHAACIYGLVRALHALEQTQAAIDLAESAVERLSADQRVEVAA